MSSRSQRPPAGGTVAAESVGSMSESPRFDVSVILPFGDDEEAVGIAVRRTAEHLRAPRPRASRSSRSTRTPATTRTPCSRCCAPRSPSFASRTRPAAAAASMPVPRAHRARCSSSSTPDVASASLDGVGDACRRLLAGDGDAEVALGRYTVAHRVRALARSAAPASSVRRCIAASPSDSPSAISRVRLTGTGVVAKTPVGRLRAFARLSGAK